MFINLSAHSLAEADRPDHLGHVNSAQLCEQYDVDVGCVNITLHSGILLLTFTLAQMGQMYPSRRRRLDV